MFSTTTNFESGLPRWPRKQARQDCAARWPLGVTRPDLTALLRPLGVSRVRPRIWGELAGPPSSANADFLLPMFGDVIAVPSGSHSCRRLRRNLASMVALGHVRFTGTRWQTARCDQTLSFPGMAGRSSASTTTSMTAGPELRRAASIAGRRSEAVAA